MKRSTSVRLSWLFFFIVVTSGALGFLSREIKPSAETTAILALNNIRDRADKGDSYAELQMGLHYTNGNGVPRDDKQAFNWFEKAANKNQIEAQYRLGMALLEGRGIEKNLKTAFYWIEQSALHGNAKAQLSLGDMYGSGMGVEVSKDKAYLWFSLAAAQGMEKAIYPRDLLAQQLDLNQLSATDDEVQRIMHNQSPRY
ncbi:MAG: tetratricopeptide repeat protein [Methylococcaceae bacterium]